MSLLERKIRIFCREECLLEGNVTILVDSIIIAKLKLSRAFVSGDYIDIPVHYFPHVTLPANLRFIFNDFEIAAPHQISSIEEVMLILGHGDIAVKNLQLENGLLRGTIVNSTNGLPVLSAHVKINSLIVRSVVLEPPRAIDEGGASSRFLVQIRSNDFTESGLSVDLFIAGIDYPVTNFTYTRTPESVSARRLIEIEDTVRQTQRSTILQIEMLRDSLERQLRFQQERIDTFVEYAMSIIIDKLAGQYEPKEQSALIEALLQLKAVGTITLPSTSALLAQSSASLALNASGFVFGWYDVEASGNGDFRWMGRTGLIRNPNLSRPILKIELIVSQVYGAAQPMIRASLDQQNLAVSVEPNADVFVVTLASPMQQPFIGESLQLESFVTGCPAVDEGAGDNRILSIALSSINFVYETAAEVRSQ